MMRMRSDIEDEEDSMPLDIDASLGIDDEAGIPMDEEPELEEVEDDDDPAAAAVAEDATEGEKDDDEWYQTLTNSFVVDPEADTRDILKSDDPQTDPYMLEQAAAKKAEAEKENGGEGEDTETQDTNKQTTAAIDSALEDINKEISALNMDLSDSEDEWDEDDGDDDIDDFKNWPMDPTVYDQPIWRPPKPGEVPDTPDTLHFIDPEAMDYGRDPSQSGWFWEGKGERPIMPEGNDDY
mmetsp:Transcript_13083/g.25633  ORF Transcript_13083/g.25633 Transcript_13083/m.25633 type:complete len:238 (+) Transcript_13083:3-716(+)